MDGDGQATHLAALRWASRHGVHPLTSAAADAMVREGDAPLTVFACWWVAIKFEEADWPLGPVHVAREAWGLHGVTMDAILEQEKIVLARQGVCIPFRTPTRAVLEAVEQDDALVQAWLYVLLLNRMSSWDTVDAWAASIKENAREGRAPCLPSNALPPSTPRILPLAGSQAFSSSSERAWWSNKRDRE